MAAANNELQLLRTLAQVSPDALNVRTDLYWRVAVILYGRVTVILHGRVAVLSVQTWS